MSTSQDLAQSTPTTLDHQDCKDSTPDSKDAPHIDEQSAIGAREGPQPDFSYSVPPLGYTWWYIDGLSHDGRYGMTVIAFIGSVFSPYYLNARQHLGKDADPRDFSAFNVALYGCGRGKWAMTERDRHSVEQTPQRLQIGPSSLDWQGETLVGHFDEVTKPVPGKVRGSFRITPLISNSCTFNLDHSGIHRWRPLAPKAHIEVELDQPSLSWQGHAYFDTNAGNEPLEEGFSSWQWLRAESDAGATVVYDLTPRHGEAHTIAYQLRASYPPCPLTLPASIELPKTLWRMPRQALGDTPQAAKVVKTLEDTPFYSRSVVETKLEDERLTAIHESLSMDRFLHPATQWMLPWRMPRCAP